MTWNERELYKAKIKRLMRLRPNDSQFPAMLIKIGLGETLTAWEKDYIKRTEKGLPK